MANTVEEGLNYLGALVDSSHGDQSTYGDVYAATSDSESYAEKSTKSAYRRAKKTSRSSRQRSPSRPPLPRLAGAEIAAALKVAPRRLTRTTNLRKIVATARNLVASRPTRMFRRHLAIGTRRASLGALTGSARKWTSIMSSDLSFLRRMESTPVAEMRVMADGVGI